MSYTTKHITAKYYFQIDAGEAPRGEKSKIIKTEHGELKSKYHYLGFGLWQNTNPIERYVPKKPSPPPPPPKAEPIWYDCTVSVETHKTSKELDDLMQVCIQVLDELMQVYLPMHILFPEQHIQQCFLDISQGLDGYDKMPNRDVEIGNAAADVPGCLGDIYEEFEKEDMSDMFKRAFLEQMEPDNNER